MARIKIEFSDEVTEKLKKLTAEFGAKSLDRVLRSVSMTTKTYILRSEQNTFVTSTSLEKATSFKKTGKARYRLSVWPRYQVHERGAFIKPVNAKALHFIGKDGKDVFAKSVRIPKRPFFKSGLREAISSDAINRAAEASIQLEMQRLGLA